MEDMVGKWKLEKRDPNFEEFLVCRQVTSPILIGVKVDLQVTSHVFIGVEVWKPVLEIVFLTCPWE